jgi:TniQ
MTMTVFKGESSQSLALRFCESKGLCGLYSFLYPLGMSYAVNSTLVQMAGRSEALALEFGVAPQTLREIGYMPGPGGYKTAVIAFGERTFPRWIVNLQKPRVCPLCIQEEEKCLQVWDLSVIGICTCHRVLLVDSCLKCGRQLSWTRRYVGACKCGRPLARAQLTPASDEAVMATTWLLGLLDGREGISADKDRFSFFSRATELIFALGRVTGALGTERRSIMELCTPQHLNQMLEVWVRAFSRLPYSYWEITDRIRQTADPSATASQQLGQFYGAITRSKGKFNRTFLKRLHEVSPRGAGSQKKFGKRLALHLQSLGHVDMSTRHLAEVLRRTESNAVAVANARNVLPTIEPDDNSMRWPIADVLAALELDPIQGCQRLRTSVTRPLVEVTGISPKRIRKAILEHDMFGLLQYGPDPSRTCLSFHVRLICNRLRRILDQCHEIRASRESYASFHEISFQGTRSCGRVINLVAAGLLTPVGYMGRRSVTDLLFDSRWLTKQRSKELGSLKSSGSALRGPDYSLEEVLIALGMEMPEQIGSLDRSLEHLRRYPAQESWLLHEA